MPELEIRAASARSGDPIRCRVRSRCAGGFFLLMLLLGIACRGFSEPARGNTVLPPAPAASDTPDHTGATTPLQVSIPPRSHLVYFGFAVVDCGWDDPNDAEEKTDYVDELAGFANVAQMCVYSPDEPLDSRLAAFARAGVKAILHVEAILFDHAPDESSPSGTRVSLRADAETLWNDFLAVNGKLLSSRNTAAVYLIDEPVWNGVSAADFSAALRIVKSSLPEIPTMAVEAYPVVDRILTPGQLDWIGFDRYDTADPERDKEWLADLQTVIAARSRPEQRIVIVASTQWLPYYQTDGGLRPEDMAAVALSYHRIAMAHPEVIALVGYLWPGGLDDPAQLGARNLPENVRQTYREIGLQILGGN